MPKTKKKKTRNRKTRKNIKKNPPKRKVQFGNSLDVCRLMKKTSIKKNNL